MIESSERLTGSVKAAQTLKGNVKSGGSSNYELPIASKDVLGGIKVGENLTIDEDGTLNAQAGLSGDIEVAEKQNNMITASLPAHVEIEQTNVGQKITSFVELTKVGDKFSVENGVIKIGKGVSKVKVAYNAVAQATASTTRVFTYIMLNDAPKSQESYYFSNEIYQVGNAIPSMLFDVKEGDEITLQVYGPAGNKILGATTFNYWTQITIEEYHDNNLVIANGEVENLNEYTKKNEIKTINGQSLLGEGDIEISGGGSGTGDVTKDEIYYKNGDVFTTSYPITIGGLITSSTTRIIFCVTPPKRLDNITKITCTSLKAELRGTNGYLNSSSGYKEYATDSNYVISCSKVNENTIEVYLTKSSAFTNINNNTFVVVRSYLGFEFE